MAAFDLSRIVAETPIRHVAYHDTCDSTNDFALRALASESRVDAPWLVLTNRQTAGRGRSGNRWWATEGSLTFSLVLQHQMWDLSTRSWPRVSLGTSLAVGEVIHSVLQGEEIQLKWPNDVYLRSRKVCGILVESSPQCPGSLVIGIGINVNNSSMDAPVELQGSSLSLREVAGRRFQRTDLLIQILRHITTRLQQIGMGTLNLPDCWTQFCMLQGRTVCVETGTQKLLGVCQGIDNEGALLLQSDAGLQRCFSGVISKIL